MMTRCDCLAMLGPIVDAQQTMALDFTSHIKLHNLQTSYAGAEEAGAYQSA